MDLTPSQERLRKMVTSSWKFGLFMLSKLPVGFFTGIRFSKLTPEESITSVPFKWLTKNPFKSIYFAVQCMAAELSTAGPCMLAIHGVKPSIAFIVLGTKANFYKKATERTYFTCLDGQEAFEAVRKAIDTSEAQTATFKTIGKLKDGTVVSEFEFTWSFKQRKS